MFDFDELDVHEPTGPPGLPLYLQVCETGGGAKGFPATWRSSVAKAAEAARVDARSPASARKLLELMCCCLAASPDVVALLGDRGGFAFDAFLQFVSRAVGTPAPELSAIRAGRCTADVFPGACRLQLCFGGLCAWCFLQRGAGSASEDPACTYVPFLCVGGEALSGEVAPACDVPSQLLSFVREASSADGRLAQFPDEWPVTWRRFAAHIGSMQALEASLAGRPPAALSADQWMALTELHHAAPALKTTQLRADHALGGVPSLLVLLHGGLQTVKHLRYMAFGADLEHITARPGEELHITGIEADFAHEEVAMGLGRPMAGYSFLRCEGCFSRLGEYAISAARAQRQCLDVFAAAHQSSRSVDLVGFSAGAMVAWLLLCLMPTARGLGLRVRTLTLLSPRLEGTHDCWDEARVKHVLEAHGTEVFLAYGALEDSRELGAPLSSFARLLETLVPAHRLRVKAYPAVGHTMQPQELADVNAFLVEVWHRNAS